MVNNAVTVAKRLGLSSILGGVLLLAAGSAVASGPASSAGATARAYAIRVVVPGQSGAEAGQQGKQADKGKLRGALGHCRVPFPIRRANRRPNWL